MANQYGEAPARTGLTINIGPIPAPVELQAHEIIYDPRQQFAADGRPLSVLEMEAAEAASNKHAAQRFRRNA